MLAPSISSKAGAEKALGLYYEKFASRFDDPESETARLCGADKRSELSLGIPYSRDADRALWAYGHLFNDTNRNRARCY